MHPAQQMRQPYYQQMQGPGVGPGARPRWPANQSMNPRIGGQPPYAGPRVTRTGGMANAGPRPGSGMPGQPGARPLTGPPQAQVQNVAAAAAMQQAAVARGPPQTGPRGGGPQAGPGPRPQAGQFKQGIRTVSLRPAVHKLLSLCTLRSGFLMSEPSSEYEDRAIASFSNSVPFCPLNQLN